MIGGGSSINGQAMQRGFPEDLTPGPRSAATSGRMPRSSPYFRKSEHDLDIEDDFHGSDGPTPRAAAADGTCTGPATRVLYRLPAGGLRRVAGYEWAIPRWPRRRALE